VSIQDIFNWNTIYGLIKLLIHIKDYIELKLVIFLLGTINYFKLQLINYLSNFTLSNEFLSDAVAFQGVIIALSIPISLQVVSWIADRYEDHEISQFFIKESLYKLQFILILPNIAISLFIRLLNTTNYHVLLFIYLWLLLNIITFYKFIKLVEQYTTNIDKILINKFMRYVDDILEE